jgi:hypothetical protein
MRWRLPTRRESERLDVEAGPRVAISSDCRPATQWPGSSCATALRWQTNPSRAWRANHQNQLPGTDQRPPPASCSVRIPLFLTILHAAKTLAALHMHRAKNTFGAPIIITGTWRSRTPSVAGVKSSPSGPRLNTRTSPGSTQLLRLSYRSKANQVPGAAHG